MNFVKYFSVIAATMLKFVGGPLTGLYLKLNWVETAICSVIGMMLAVVSIMFLGEFLSRIRQYFPAQKPKKIFNRINRLAVKVRQKFGLIGIAFLTPLIFTPVGGTILALAFGYSRPKILMMMFFWASFWGVVQTLFFYYLKDLIWR